MSIIKRVLNWSGWSLFISLASLDLLCFLLLVQSRDGELTTDRTWVERGRCYGSEFTAAPLGTAGDGSRLELKRAGHRRLRGKETVTPTANAVPIFSQLCNRGRIPALALWPHRRLVSYPANARWRGAGCGHTRRSTSPLVTVHASRAA